MPNLKCGTTINSRYKVERFITSTYNSEIYRVFDNRHNNYKIFKRYDYCDLNSCRREAEMLKLAAVDVCPNFFDFISDDSNPGIIMSFVQGVTLDKIIKWKRFLRKTFLISIIKSLCISVNMIYKHTENKVLFAALNPKQLVYSNNTVYIQDFSSAFICGSPDLFIKEDYEYSMIKYMAPEVAAGYTSNSQSIIYSVGIIMFELLSKEELEYDIFDNVIFDFEKDIYKLISRCTDIQPNNRYNSIDALLFDIKQYLR